MGFCQKRRQAIIRSEMGQNRPPPTRGLLAKARPWAAPLLALLLVSGCAQGGQDNFLSHYLSPGKTDPSQSGGLGAFGRGDLVAAEREAAQTLQKDPRDPYAMLAAGLVHQARNRFDQARPYYETLVAMKPAAIASVGLDGLAGQRTIGEIAASHLAMLDKARGISPQPSYRATLVQTTRRAPVAAAAGQELPVFAGPRGQVAARFQALRRLYDEGLITPDEYSSRRRANLGSLLPYSQPAGGAGLERPIPSAEQIVQRLHDLNLNLETRNISPREHQAERLVILEALLPASPKALANPPPPPEDMVAAAPWFGFLEKLQETDVISASEAQAEKAALQRLVDAKVSEAAERQRMALESQELPPPTNDVAPLGVAHMAARGQATPINGAGMHLASVRSEAAGAKIWASLQRKFPELKSLSYVLGKADLGGGNAYWRVIAGPVEPDAATKFCQNAKLKRQFCDVVAFDAN